MKNTTTPKPPAIPPLPPASGSAQLFSPRHARLSELRARWAIKQEQATQLAQAIEVLADSKMSDDAAMSVAEKIINANIGP